MKKSKSEVRNQKLDIKKISNRYARKIALVCILSAVLFSPAFSGEKWPGVDEAVVEKYAKENGREARVPLINTDQGDLLLFVFLLAGALGGFAAGYYWRMLISEKPKKTQ